MRFVQRDAVVEDLSPATSHPSFRSSILPWRLYTGPFGPQSSGLQKGDHVLVERRISIEDGIARRTRFRESLAQLLDHPVPCRVVSHVEVQNPAPPDVDIPTALLFFRDRARSPRDDSVRTSASSYQGRRDAVCVVDTALHSAPRR